MFSGAATLGVAIGRAALLTLCLLADALGCEEAPTDILALLGQH